MPYSKVHKRAEEINVVPVPDVVSDFLSSVEVKSLVVKTQKEYTYTLGVFAKWCSTSALTQNKKDSSWAVVKSRDHHDPIYLHKINEQVVYLFLEHLQETHKPSKASNTELSSSTFALYVKNIKRLLNWCLLDDVYSDHVKAVTVSRIKKPEVIDVIIETFSEDDIEAIFDACNKEVYEHLQVRDKAIVALLLDTGIRATELCTLTIGNVCLDPKDSHIKVFGKGKKWGEVGFGEQTRRYMQKYLRTFREPTIEHAVQTAHHNMSERQLTHVIKREKEQSVFFVNRSAQPMTRSGLLQLIVRLGEWADIEGVRCSPHTWRHTFAAMFMKNGGDIYKLSRLLRHTSVKVTEQYLKSLRQSEARKGAKSNLDNMI